MSEQLEIVTIDGPSGVGKSTISRKIAASLGFTYLDTGAMYRAVACFLVQEGIDLEDETAIGESLQQLKLELIPATDETGDVGVIINGRDVSGEIRTPETSMAASKVSALGVVRSKLTQLQQDIGENGRIVAEGRDTGTVVFPKAAYKFFLDADPQERTRRRVLQLQAKGEEVDEAEILRQTLERDKNDSERALAPLKKAEDGISVDTTAITIEQVTAVILTAIKMKQEKKG